MPTQSFPPSKESISKVFNVFIMMEDNWLIKVGKFFGKWFSPNLKIG
jgi:hypothetical protein